MNYGKSATMRRIRKFDSKGTKIKSKVKVLFCKFFLAIVIVFGAVGISSGIGVLNGIIDSAPDISAIDVTPTGYSSTVLMTTTELTCMVLPELLLQVLKMVETLIRVPALSHSSLSKTTFLPAGQAKHRLSKRCSVRSRNSICLWNLKNRSIKNGSSRTT